VKNVAGFDLPRLMVGSLGTLGLIATATLRLHPKPEEEVTLLVSRKKAPRLRALVAAVRGAQLEPTSFVARLGPDGFFDVGVRFEGFRAGVAEQRDRMNRLLVEEEEEAGEVLDEAAAREFWSRHDGLRSSPALRLRLSALPSHIEAIAAGVVPQ